MKQQKYFLPTIASLFLACFNQSFAQEPNIKSNQPESGLDQYNVVWDTPSENSAGSMPLGNGDIALNAWVEKNGDLVFYIAKSDAWSGSLDFPHNGAYGLIKVGRVRVSLSPAQTGEGFRQELQLRQGMMEVSAGPAGKGGTLRLWVDANRPVIHVESHTAVPVRMTVRLESWRTEPTEYLASDTIIPGQKDRIIWYYKGLNRQIPPLVDRTIGAAILGEGMAGVDSTTLVSNGPGTKQHVTIHPLTAQAPTQEQWMARLDQQISKSLAAPLEQACREHLGWWAQFWDRSHIFITAGDNAREVTTGYILQRFKNACTGRGAYPIKFNGSLFNVDNPEPMKFDDKLVPVTADFRVWGHKYWFQNTRAIYWPMLASGDFDLMQPLFRMYAAQISNNAKIVREYYGHDGAYFADSGPFWGEIPKIGPNDSGRYFTPVLELSAMMLDYYNFTQDQAYARSTLIPVADAGVTFYDQHFKRDANGKLLIDPADSIEMFWNVRNPLPDIAGLRYVLGRLLELPPSLTRPAMVQRWKRLLGEIPEIPVGMRGDKKQLLPMEDGQTVKAMNMENPELYAIYPFRVYGIQKPDLEIARHAFAARKWSNNHCWSQEAVQAAFLGETETARKNVVSHLTYKDPRMRFPAFWEKGFDYCPDEDNGGNGLHALQTMLLQSDGSKILLLPAWPTKWEADFKLRAPLQTTVEGVVRKGRLVQLKVTPESRRKDVVVLEKTPAGLITPEMNATASEDCGGPFLASSAIDGDPETRWATMARQGWLQVDLGRPMTFRRVAISEAFTPRVQSFELQYKEGENWKTCFTGTTLSEKFEAQFPPVTAQVVRLNILKATEGPTIWDFQLKAN